jgi:hypothetical protein
LSTQGNRPKAWHVWPGDVAATARRRAVTDLSMLFQRALAEIVEVKAAGLASNHIREKVNEVKLAATSEVALW